MIETFNHKHTINDRKIDIDAFKTTFQSSKFTTSCQKRKQSTKVKRKNLKDIVNTTIYHDERQNRVLQSSTNDESKLKEQIAFSKFETFRSMLKTKDNEKIDQDHKSNAFRNRINSFITLKSKSNDNSQSKSKAQVHQKTIKVKSRTSLVLKKSSKSIIALTITFTNSLKTTITTTLSITKIVVFEKLFTIIKRYYLVFLSNKMIDESMMHIFSNMKL